MKPLCDFCKKRPKAINYVKNDKTHYRSRCSHCISKGNKVKNFVPSWIISGFKKKLKCDRCNFLAKHQEQIFVYYVDGDRKNNQHSNLRCICANCSIELTVNNTGWTSDDLELD